MYEEPLLDKSRGFNDSARDKKFQLQQEQKDEEMELEAVIHQLNSFFAVVWPVSISIICSRYCKLLFTVYNVELVSYLTLCLFAQSRCFVHLRPCDGASHDVRAQQLTSETRVWFSN